MHLRKINPWSWQDTLGYSQAIEVSHSSGTLYVAGQAAMDNNGRPAGVNMKEQAIKCISNLETVITGSGYSINGIVMLNFYTTSIPLFFENYGIITAWLAKHGCQPSSTLVEVKALAFPELMLEVEATVCR